MTDTLRKLRDANCFRQLEWDPEAAIDPAYRGLELGGEAGEALNVIKKLEREARGVRGARATIAELADELADVIICCDLVAAHYGIDLIAAVPIKFNKTSDKVGLKTKMEMPS